MVSQVSAPSKRTSTNLRQEPTLTEKEPTLTETKQPSPKRNSPHRNDTTPSPRGGNRKQAGTGNLRKNLPFKRAGVTNPHPKEPQPRVVDHRPCPIPLLNRDTKLASGAGAGGQEGYCARRPFPSPTGQTDILAVSDSDTEKVPFVANGNYNRRGRQRPRPDCTKKHRDCIKNVVRAGGEENRRLIRRRVRT